MREPINQVLNRIWEYPLIVVEAPMGYGKTTAVKEYLQRSEANVLWHTLIDDSATGFWNGFCRLLSKFEQAAADSLKGMGIPGNSVFLEEAIRIVGDIEFPARTVIVLDDYHLLLSEDIDRFIELLVKSEVPNLHIVIVSRSVFGENTTELVLKGYCWVIDKNYFELTKAEIVEYCRLCGVNLNTEEADFLHSYTEGWISAVYLCILGFLEDGRIERQASLHEMIEKVVYRRSTAEVKEFLLHICIFDIFSLEQAEYMWPKGNAGELLMQLVAQNAFIKYDQMNKTYYMHNIFTNYLRWIFDRQDLGKRQTAWKMAGEWYLSAGDFIHAMNYFYRADDFDRLLTVVEVDKGNSFTNEHKQMLIGYFNACPAEIKMRHPWAGLIYAINLCSFNEIELFGQQCEVIAGFIELSPWLDDESRIKLAGELELLIGFTKYNSITGMSEHHQRACGLLKGPADFIDKKGSWTFGSPSVLYMFYRASGRLVQEVQEMYEAMPHYCRLTAGHGFGAEYVMQGERYYFSGDFENAEILVHKAMYSAQSHDQVAIVLCARFLQLRLAVIKGDLAYITSTLKQTREEIKEQGLYLYIHTWDLCEGFIYSFLNQDKQIPVWIVQGDLQDSAIYFPSYAFFNIIWGRVLLNGGQYLKLIGLAEGFIDIASVFPNLLGQVYTYIYEAAAKFKLGWHEDAQETLGKAMAIAAPDEIIMPFVENGEYIGDILAVLERKGYYSEFIGRVLRLLPSILKAREAMAVTLNSSDSKWMLTEREVAIAELVATGLSNGAIGKTLHIAEITVKKALQSIYAKLGISNRTALTKIMIERRTG